MVNRAVPGRRRLTDFAFHEKDLVGIALKANRTYVLLPLMRAMYVCLAIYKNASWAKADTLSLSA